MLDTGEVAVGLSACREPSWRPCEQIRRLTLQIFVASTFPLPHCSPGFSEDGRELFNRLPTVRGQLTTGHPNRLNPVAGLQVWLHRSCSERSVSRLHCTPCSNILHTPPLQDHPYHLRSTPPFVLRGKTSCTTNSGRRGKGHRPPSMSKTRSRECSFLVELSKARQENECHVMSTGSVLMYDRKSHDLGRFCGKIFGFATKPSQVR